ncbi:hypothetical protein GLU60_01995 [Nanohaloarchaea archaeon H01]|nr:hypothetical protein [Nanohaloarchaea archaeon H01]
MKKIGVIFLVFLVVAGAASSARFESPGSQTQIEFNVELVDIDSAAENVNITLEDGPSSPVEKIELSPSNENVSTSFDGGEVNSGQYTIEAVIYRNTETLETLSKEFTVDGTSPDITFPDERFLSEDPTVSVEFFDEHTGLSSFSGEVDNNVDISDSQGFDDCSADNTCTAEFELDTSEIDSGDTFVLTAASQDKVGNDIERSSDSFELDTSYEADQPEFSIPDADDNDDVHVTGDVEVDVTVDNIDEETSDGVRVTCFVDGEELDQTDFDDENDFSCDLFEDDLEDGDSEVSVEACDQAGNCEISDERSFTFDSTPPILDSFSTVQDYKKFGGGFEAEFNAEDPDSGIQKAEYFFSTAVLPGEGNDVDQVDDERFTVEESEITTDDVDQTVYLRVMNDVGQWSDRESVEFEYYPDEAPEVSLGVPENVTVVAGEQKSFDVVVENTGTLLVDSVDVKVSSDVLEGTEELSDISESETATFELSPNQSQIGRYEVTVETDGPVDSASFDLSVEANVEQRQQIESRLSGLSSEAEKVRSNISDLRSDGIDSDLNRTIEEDVDPFVQKVERAQNLTQQGKYYVAQNVLESVEQLEGSAEDSLNQVRKEERVRERNRLIKMVLAVLAVLVAAVIGLLVYARREDIGEKDLSIGNLNVPDMSSTRKKSHELIDGIKEKVEQLEDEIDQKEEEAEKKFEGFK